MGVKFLFAIMFLEFLCFSLYKYLADKNFPRRGVLAVKYIMSPDPNFLPGEYSPSPYILYRNKKNHFYMGLRQTDQNGYRWHGSELHLTPEGEEFRILCLGGSTTYSNHVTRDVEKSWCYQLEKKLNKVQHGKIRVINAGLNYAMSSELLAEYVFHAQNFNPRIVIIHGPGNDSLPIANGDSTFDYGNTRRSLYFQKRRFEKTLLKFSSVLKMLYVIWLDRSSLVSLEPENMPPVEIQNERLKKSEFQQFKSNLENMLILMLSKEIKIILVPFLQASKNKIQEHHPGLSEGMVTANKKMSEIMKDFSDLNKNVYYVDFTKFEFKDELFLDSCHLYNEGEELKAQIIYDFIKNNNLVN